MSTGRLGPHIAVDEFEGLLGSCSQLVGGLPVLFSFQTCFAYSHCRPEFFSHSVDHFCKFPDVVLSDMAHTSMPDVDIQLGCRLFGDLLHICKDICIAGHSEVEQSSCNMDRSGD